MIGKVDVSCHGVGGVMEVVGWCSRWGGLGDILRKGSSITPEGGIFLVSGFLFLKPSSRNSLWDLAAS